MCSAHNLTAPNVMHSVYIVKSTALHEKGLEECTDLTFWCTCSILANYFAPIQVWFVPLKILHSFHSLRSYIYIVLAILLKVCRLFPQGNLILLVFKILLVMFAFLQYHTECAYRCLWAWVMLHLEYIWRRLAQHCIFPVGVFGVGCCGSIDE